MATLFRTCPACGFDKCWVRAKICENCFFDLEEKPKPLPKPNRKKKRSNPQPTSTTFSNLDRKYDLCKMALSAAVPLWQMQMAEWTPQQISEKAAECAEVLHEKSEYLMYRGKDDYTADAFNAVAKAIACLSFCPGGVTAFGTRFEAKGNSDGN